MSNAARFAVPGSGDNSKAPVYNSGTDTWDLAAPLIVVAHGATAGTTRPSGAAAVYWIGSVEPTNAQNQDLWYDNS